MNDDNPSNSPIFHDLSGAVIAKPKITEYLLNLDHQDGGAKAKFFLERGFTFQNWNELSKSLLCQGKSNPVEKYIRNKYGMKILVRCNMLSPDGKNPCILSVWMQENDGPPRFITAYPSE